MRTILKRLLVGSCVALLFVESAGAQSTEKVIFNLGTPEGTEGGLIVDDQGNLYGAADGQSINPGTVYMAKRFANGTWGHYVLYYFLGGTDGRNPNPGMVFDSAGNLYGSTVLGGANYCPASNVSATCGTVFELTPTPTGTWTEKQLYNFGGFANGDGFYPTSGLVSDSAGNLYGTTAFGGLGSAPGTVFQLTPASNETWTETILHQFSGGEGGFSPSGLIRDSKGNLYGVAGGGTTGAGMIFELSPNTDGTWSFHSVYSFCSRENCSDGGGPEGITLDSQNNLYGVAAYGGTVPCWSSDTGCGTIFKLVRGIGDAWVLDLLHSFCTESGCPDGAQPWGAPTQQSDGTLYGLTFLGGNTNQGTVFKLVQTSTAWVLTSLYSFCPSFPYSFCTDGRYPVGKLALDRSGNLYGTTASGGQAGTGRSGTGNGVVFQVNISQFATSVTLSSTLNPSIYGQKVTWTAVVSTSGVIPPTGMVYFTSPGGSIGSATLNSSGVATLARSHLNADPYPLTAVYNGDVNNFRSTSPVLNQVVLQTTSAATIKPSVNPSTVGQPVAFTAKITSPTVTATGPVTFTLGKTTLGTVQLGGGKATFTTSSLPVGSNVVKVTYNGDSNIAGSSAVVTQVVQP